MTRDDLFEMMEQLGSFHPLSQVLGEFSSAGLSALDTTVLEYLSCSRKLGGG